MVRSREERHNPTTEHHLGVYCTVGGYPLARADQVLELVG